MKIVLLGSPGVGKGTYASMIKEKYKLAHISTGDLIREEMRKDSELGKKAKTFYDKGELVPDEITLELLKKRLEKKDAKNFLLDGFPRSIKQAEALEKITKIDRVVNFYASDKVIQHRLSGRRICKKCGAIFHIVTRAPKKPGICDLCGGELYQRADETPAVIKDRLRLYREKTKPLEEYYRKKGILREICADTDSKAPDFKEKVIDKIEAVFNEVK